LVNAQKLGEAVEEFRQAIQLRPHHYYQWLDLGVTLHRLNDARGAEQALRRSVDLAPAFAQPHWQLGNFLFRDNRYDEAFEQLRLGARGNAGEFQSLLDLAWLAADGNVASFEDFVRPEDQLAHLKTARDLVGHGKGAESVWHLKAGGPPVNEDNAAVLREIISQLISNKQFSAAYEAWLVNHADFPNDVRGEGIVLNGDFNYAIAQNDPGFNWQFLRGNAIAVSIDPAGAVPGTRSVHLDLSGETAPEAILLSELVLVQPNTRYSLGFMFKTRELVTGGPPRIVVMANGADGKETLGESRTLAPGTSEWQQDTVNFSTRADTSAIVVALQRRSCSQSPCPIFGGIWLGRVSLSRGK
jgi:tetratricopeptide (TPR) repeat protein